MLAFAEMEHENLYRIIMLSILGTCSKKCIHITLQFFIISQFELRKNTRNTAY